MLSTSMSGGSLRKLDTQQHEHNRSEHNKNNIKILVLYGLDEIRNESEAELCDRVIDVFQGIAQVDNLLGEVGPADP